MVCNFDDETVSGPNEAELYSKNTAERLCYALGAMGLSAEPWVRVAAQSPTGYAGRATDLTRDLCHLIGRMTHVQQQNIIYNGRDAEARKLADWWDAHKITDTKREAAEVAELRLKTVASGIVSLLNDEGKAAMRWAYENGLLT